MVTIPLSATYRCKNAGKYSAVVDDQDGDLARLSWYAKVHRRGSNKLVYAVRNRLQSEGAGRECLHRVVARRAFGDAVTDSVQIDHANPGEFGGLDNRRSNLRIATNALNVANGRVRSNNTSGVKGVHWVKRIEKWQALIRVDGKRRHLGYFDRVEDAALAYNAAASVSWGEFARLNDGATCR